MSTSTQQDDWFSCPVCGEVVDANALACPHCGADDETGWSEDAAYDDVDLPDEAFREPARPVKQSKSWFALLAIAMAGLILLLSMLGVW